MTEFDTAILIGRFQPYHLGHAGLLRKAFQTGKRVEIVLGSAFAAPSPRNPFTSCEREAMIRASLTDEENARVRFHPQRDVWDTGIWAKIVRSRIEGLAPGRVALVGYHKDSTSSYLDTFPEWTLIDAGRQGPLDATPLREQILSDRPWEEVKSDLSVHIPAPALEWLSVWARSPVREGLALDREAIATYQARWGKGPFSTVDAIVCACGQVLLIRRKDRPGQGLWALPGGFLESAEALEEGARRELLEETGLDLSGCQATRTQLFAHPGRSLRARIITHAYLFEPDWQTLPEVTGSDDALAAEWIPLADLPGMESEFFGDHFHILDEFLGILDQSEI